MARLNAPLRVVADLGGTRARFMRADDGRRAECAARDHASIDSVVAAGLDALDVQSAGVEAAIAVAGPVRGGHASFTNVGWRVDAAQLAGRFGFARVLLLNDVEAAALGAAAALPRDALPVHAAPRDASLRHAVINVGTGLGVAYWRGTADVDASEAGHAGFAPGPGWAQRLPVQPGDGRVSWEQVLSGAGLRAIDAQVRGTPLDDGAEVTRRARAGDADAAVAVARFAFLLGLFAGDIVLAAPAPGGVLLAGGVVAGVWPVFDDRAFAAGYLSGRRVPGPLAAAPVWRSAADDLGLAGALAALAIA